MTHSGVFGVSSERMADTIQTTVCNFLGQHFLQQGSAREGFILVLRHIDNMSGYYSSVQLQLLS